MKTNPVLVLWRVGMSVFEGRFCTFIPLDHAAHRVLVGVRVVDAEDHETAEAQGKQRPVVLEGKVGPALEADDHWRHDCSGSRQSNREADRAVDRLADVKLAESRNQGPARSGPLRLPSGRTSSGHDRGDGRGRAGAEELLERLVTGFPRQTRS